MSTPAYGCPFCSTIFAEEEQMLCHFLQESKDHECSQERRKGKIGKDNDNLKETVQVEVGDDPSKAQVITPSGSVLLASRKIKEEIIVECDDDDDYDEEEEIKKVEAIVGSAKLQTSGENDSSCFLARIAGTDIRIPTIKRTSKIKYRKMVEELADMKTISYILPPTQMQSVLQYLSQHSDMVVETDVGNFDLHQMRYMDFLHRLYVNRAQVKEENAWFMEELIMPFQCEEAIDVETVYRFHEVIQESSCSVTVGLPSCTALVSDLLSLPCDRWLTDGLLDCFSHIVRRSAASPTEVFNVTELVGMSEVCVLLEERYPDKTGLQVIFLLHVGKAENEATQSQSSSSNSHPYTSSHFSFALYSFDRNVVIYADTLGWSIPEPLCFMMEEFITHFGLSDPTYTCLHDPGSFIDGDNHKCTYKCSRIYPVEQADSAYGLAVVVGFCLAAVDKDAFELLTATQRKACLPNKLDYLQDIAQYSKFLRLVLISWLMQGDIKVAMLYQVLETPTHRMPLLNSRRRKKVPNSASPSINPKQEVSMSTNITRGGGKAEPHTTKVSEDLNFEKIRELLAKPPEVGYLRSYSSLRVRFYLRNGRVVTKRFKCSSAGKRDQRALRKLQDYVDRDDVFVYLKSQSEVRPKYKKNWLRSSNEAVNAILLKAELVTQGAGSLRLRCTLTNGVTKSKIYNGEKDDPKVRSEVLEFLSSRMCEEWLKEERKWDYLGDVNVGPDTRAYVDNIPFDVKKKLMKVDRRIRPVSDAGTLSVSVETNPNWGRLHRYDETYILKDKKIRPRERFMAASMTLQCASLTSECRSDCGIPLHLITTHGKICSGCQLSLDSGRICEGCFTSDSPHWYSNDVAATLCNACYRANGRRKTQRRIDKIHHPHLKCKWKLRFELDQDLKVWKVYKGTTNEFYHRAEPVGERKRPTWMERDVWDRARILSNATAQEIYNSMQQEMPLLSSSDPSNATEALGKISRRCKSIDRKYLHLAMNWRKDPNPTCSDWRKAEKVLETNFENVLHYQRGDKHLNRDYRIILATDENLLALRHLGREVIGVDSKEDFMKSCFKTCYVTYYDQEGQEEVAVSAVYSKESEDTYLLVFQMIAANLPCQDRSCTHPKVLHIYDDENGFFWTRPCSAKGEYHPLVQHENKNELRNAVTYMLWFSSLYNFNTLETVRAQICNLENMHVFITTIELGFKCVLMAWNNEMRKRLQHSYKDLIINCVPDALVSLANRETFVMFLDKLWFETPWSDSYTCQVVFRVPTAYRKNGLLSIEHLPARKVREVDEQDSSTRSRRMSQYVVKMLNKVLHRGNFQENLSSEDTEAGHNARKDREIMAIQKALKLSSSGSVISHPGWEEHGFVSVMEGKEDGNLEVELEENEEQEVPILTDPAHSKKMLQVQLEDDTEGDLTTLAEKASIHLKALALDLYRQEIMRYLSPRVRSNISSKDHICNVHLRSCTCHTFINRGQTELCKHLFAALITTRQLRDLETVMVEGAKWFPKVPVPLKNHINFSKTITLPGFLANKVECLRAVSRRATKKDMELARQGQILKVLHGSPSVSSPSKSGTNKSSDNSIAVKKYSMTDLADPYCPNIDFPKSLRGRPTKRGNGRRGVKRSSEIDAATEAVQKETKKMRVTSSESVWEEFGDNNVFCVTLPDDTTEELQEISGSDEAREVREGYGSSSSSSVYQSKGFPSVVCGRCLDENKDSPQLCYSPKELKTHIDREHSNKTIACAFCYFNNVTVRYASEKEFQDHLMQEH